MLRPIPVLGVAALTWFLGACGGPAANNSPSRSAHDAKPGAPTSDTDAEPAEETWAGDSAGSSDADAAEEGPAGADESETTSSEAPAKDDKYEIGYQDCNALAGTYGRAWRRDEMAKLEQARLKSAQKESARQRLGRESDKAAGQWREECHHMVGTLMSRRHLKCALRAKTLERFNDCFNGKIEP